MKKIGIYKKFIIIFLFLFSFSLVSFSQLDPLENYEGKTINDLIQMHQPYYDSLKSNLSDSILYKEGSEYNQWENYKQFWLKTLSAFNGSFEDYYHYQLVYYKRNESNNNKSNSSPWYEIGPKTHMATKPVNTTGPVKFIDFYEPSTNYMLCGSATGGLFFSDDSGLNWQNAGSDNWYSSATCSAVFSSNDPSVWYAVSQTGRASNQFTPIGYIGGIIKYTNYGSSLDVIGNYNDFGGIWTKIFKLKNDKNNSNIMYACTSNGLYICTDINNATPNAGFWNNLNIPLANSVATAWQNYSFDNSRHCYDFEIDPNNSNHLFVCVRYHGVQGTNEIKPWTIFESFDQGANWSEISLPNTLGYSSEEIKYINFEISAFDNSFYCFFTQVGNQGKISKRDLNGSTSLTLIRDNNSNDVNDNIFTFNEQFNYGRCFGVSQTTAGEFFVGNSTAIKGIIGNTNVNQSGFHSDVEYIVFHPTNDGEIWMATHGGVTVSYDKGVSWNKRSNGLGVAEVNTMSTDYLDPSYILVGLYHDYSQLSTTPYTNNNWQTEWIDDHKGGDGQACLIDPTDDNIMWTSVQYTPTLYKSINKLQSNFPNYSTCKFKSAIEMNLNGHFYFNKFVVSEVKADLFQSFNKNITNRRISDFSQFIQGDYFVYKIALSNSPQYVYVDVIDQNNSHHLFRTQNALSNNVTWEELPIPVNSWMSIKVDYSNPNVVYLGFPDPTNYSGSFLGQKMFYKMNYQNPSNVDCANGINCTDLTNGLPRSQIRSIELEKGTESGIYVTTTFGVYYTNNDLLQQTYHWQKLGTLPNVHINKIEINYVVNKIRAGTFGRGVWEHDLICPKCFDNTITSDHTQNDFIECQNNIFSSVKVNPQLDVSYRAGNYVHLTPGFHATQNSNFHAFIHPCNKPGNSFKSNNQSNSQNNQTLNIEPNKLNEDLKFLIYPNPTNSSCTIEVNQNINSFNIKIVSLSGKMVYNKKVTAQNKTKINTSNFESGLYFVTVTFDNNVSTQKLIIQ